MVACMNTQACEAQHHTGAISLSSYGHSKPKPTLRYNNTIKDIAVPVGYEVGMIQSLHIYLSSSVCNTLFTLSLHSLI